MIITSALFHCRNILFAMPSIFLTIVTTGNSFVGETVDSVSSVAAQCPYKVGDKVKVDLEMEIFKAMQEGHGGWNPRMGEV